MGRKFSQLAREHRVPVFYEAAVAGGIPIIKVVREAFVGNRFESIHGILNGTSNYILTRMTDTGMDFAPALEEAKAARLRGGRSHARHQRLGRRAQGDHSRLARLRLLARSEADLGCRHRQRHGRRTSVFAKNSATASSSSPPSRANAESEIEVRVCPDAHPDRHMCWPR